MTAQAERSRRFRDRHPGADRNYYWENRDELRKKAAERYRNGGRERVLERQLMQTLERFGIDRELYDRLLAEGCAICHAAQSGKRRLHIDHDHVTGRFRGLLCGGCNGALGLFKDEPRLLAKAITYLEMYR